jgi:hypothetical protein
MPAPTIPAEHRLNDFSPEDPLVLAVLGGAVLGGAVLVLWLPGPLAVTAGALSAAGFLVWNWLFPDD